MSDRVKPFSALCSELSSAHREWHLTPTDSNRVKAVMALFALTERCRVTWNLTNEDI